MPLIKSPSQTAFKSNLEKELAAGKPKKQAAAISYAPKRKSGGLRAALGMKPK